MEDSVYRFGPFALSPADRLLRRGDAVVELSPRYFDALVLLVREHGRLVTKTRLLEEVWRGVPVTDEALTQCVRALRRQLGDDAARPLFIETAHKHGYRFIAEVSRDQIAAVEPKPGPAADRAAALRLLAAGAAGGGAAGGLGGLAYGAAAASSAAGTGMGGTSVLLVMTCVTALLGVTGGGGVALGIAAARTQRGRFDRWSVAGGAAGGLLVGAAVKLVGVDAFELLLGSTPGDITGALEGALLGGAVGAAVRLSADKGRVRQAMVTGGALGAAAGAVLPWLGGRLLAGSLESLALRFPRSRLNLDGLGALFGETGLGPISRTVLTAAEAGLFAACVAGAAVLMLRRTEDGATRGR